MKEDKTAKEILLKYVELESLRTHQFTMEDLDDEAIETSLKATKEFALQESRKAFEAGRKIVVDMTEDLEYYKYDTFEDYLASENQQLLTK